MNELFTVSFMVFIFQKKRGESKMKKRILKAIPIVFILALMVSMTVFAADGEAVAQSNMYGTIWALVPPVVAIVLALITKEVYSSLFVGILVGALFNANFGFEGTIHQVLDGGIIASLTSAGNVGILIFLVILGAIVCLMNKAGGSAAFGRWAQSHIKSRVGAQLATVALGVLIFVDDYFNCLTVGSVMRPVTDRFKVSRSKLSYIIDATAAPVCIIAPISSWAAAVTSYVDVDNGFELFIRTIPYNFYALLTIVMMVAMVLLKVEYGPMKKHEVNALDGDLFTSGKEEFEHVSDDTDAEGGKVIDLVLPVAVLIACCIVGMVYTGGFFEGVNFIEAFANCSASIGLAIGSLLALIIIIVYFLIRRRLNFTECMGCIPEGFKAMVPAILILTFAWTLNTMTSNLGAAEFVAGAVAKVGADLMMFFPAVVFLVACFLAFSTGTSWGTFGILLPIVLVIFGETNPELMVISMSACMAGAVCGDHCSPISDTTIMASAGAQCNHVNHVSTQLPYAIVAAAVSFVTYIVAGIVQTAWIALPVGIALMLGTLFVIKKIHK